MRQMKSLLMGSTPSWSVEQLVENDEGLNAWMGDGGRQLSGGEQRRLGAGKSHTP